MHAKEDVKNVLSHITVDGQVVYGRYVTVIYPPEGFSTAKTIISSKPLSDEEITSVLDQMVHTNAQRMLEVASREGLTRVVLPPAVSEAIARQREAITAKTRSKAAKAAAQDRKDRGELPGFMRKRK